MNKEKTYILENLGCANCAAKMESKIRSLEEIESASITFATKQLKISAKNPDSLKEEIQHICQSIEEPVVLVEKDAVSDVATRNHNFLARHKIELLTLVLGILLFAIGVVLQDLLIIFAAAYLLLGYKVLFTAGRNILHGQIFDENFLMSIATLAAFCIGDFAEGAGVMLFYRIGELFEEIAVDKSRRQIMNAVDMRPETVMLVDSDCGCCHDHHDSHTETHIIPAKGAKPGDILLVRPGDRIPLDGVIVEGESRIDTSPVTGEPVPVKVVSGSEVISGCINKNGTLQIKVTHPLSESMVTKILASVENAAASKPKIDKFITKFAKIYTPIVVGLAVLTAVIPSIVTGNWLYWIKTAITFLVISCPCALVISVPLAFFCGIGAASKKGILFKGGLAIEALRKVKGIVMDKTGTITQGVFAVNSISTFNDMSRSEVLSVAAACEASSSHPIAVSICEKAHQLLNNHTPDSSQGKLYIPVIESSQELAGLGIKARLKMHPDDTELTALCGNRKLMAEHNIAIPDLSPASGTEILVAIDGTLAGRITISDKIKDNSIGSIGRIKAMGLEPAMLTGDNMQSAAAVASVCGISQVKGSLLPEEKLEALQELRTDLGPVMFVGDGINDAPVLAGADVGAAMGSGTDAAIEAADVVFMTSSLEAVPESVSIARYTGRIALQNIVIALAIKLLVIIIGLVGFANIWAAVFADTGVAMLCIINSLRILLRRS